MSEHSNVHRVLSKKMDDIFLDRYTGQTFSVATIISMICMMSADEANAWLERFVEVSNGDESD